MRAGTVVRTDEDRIDCDATIEAGGCPWKTAADGRGEPVYGMMGTYCWYRGKVGTWMLQALQRAGHYLPEAINTGFYGDDEAEPNLSPEHCVALGTFMQDRVEAFAAQVAKEEPDQVRNLVEQYRYAAWWLTFVGEHADGANAWW